MVKRFQQSGRSGFYCAVVREGAIAVVTRSVDLGRSARRHRCRPRAPVTCPKLPDQALLRRAIAVAALPESWRESPSALVTWNCRPDARVAPFSRSAELVAAALARVRCAAGLVRAAVTGDLPLTDGGSARSTPCVFCRVCMLAQPPRCFRCRRVLLAWVCICAAMVAATRPLPPADRPVRTVPDPAWLRYGSVAGAEPTPASRIPDQIMVFGTDPVLTTAGDELAAGLERLSGRRPRIVAAAQRTPIADPRDAASARSREGDRGRHRARSGPEDFWITERPGGSLLDRRRRPRTRRAVRRVRAAAPACHRSGGARQRGAAGPGRADPLGQPVGQPRWHDRARLRRPVDLLRQRHGRRRPLPRPRLRAAARVGRHQRLHDQQRQRQHARDHPGIPAAARAGGRRVPALGRPALRLGRLQQPQKLGGLDTFDPLDPRVAAWWRAKRRRASTARFPTSAASCSRPTPKAASGRRPTAARTPTRPTSSRARSRRTAACSSIAGFVYDHHMDWRDPRRTTAPGPPTTTSRRSTASSTTTSSSRSSTARSTSRCASRRRRSSRRCRRTNQAIELQITQEYIGQQRHVVFLAPMWKEVLDFDMQADGARDAGQGSSSPGATFDRPLGGFVGVSNVGLDRQLARAPSRAWRTSTASAGSRGIPPSRAEPHRRRVDAPHVWPRPAVVDDRQRHPAGLVADLRTLHRAARRRHAHRHHRHPLRPRRRVVRAQRLGPVAPRRRARASAWTAPSPPAPASSASTRRPSRAMYESLETCPDELLLFMHHVPYTHVLHSGKTVIQHIYDSHYQGAAEAGAVRRALAHARGPRRRRSATGRCSRASSTRPDTPSCGATPCAVVPPHLRDPRRGRAASAACPGRLEAEAAQLTGYAPIDVTPWETASRGKAVACTREERLRRTLAIRRRRRPVQPPRALLRRARRRLDGISCWRPGDPPPSGRLTTTCRPQSRMDTRPSGACSAASGWRRVTRSGSTRSRTRTGACRAGLHRACPAAVTADDQRPLSCIHGGARRCRQRCSLAAPRALREPPACHRSAGGVITRFQGDSGQPARGGSGMCPPARPCPADVSAHTHGLIRPGSRGAPARAVASGYRAGGADSRVSHGCSRLEPGAWHLAFSRRTARRPQTGDFT